MLNIIHKYINKKKNYTLNNIIFTRLKTFYEELNNINLTHLNKLKYYWCINSSTNELYLYDFIINKKKKENHY
jgi:hypothetical protein